MALFFMDTIWLIKENFVFLHSLRLNSVNKNNNKFNR